MSKKVLMILSKEFKTDPRVNKEAASLIENGYKVTVICWDRRNSFPSKENINGIEVNRFTNSIFMKILPNDLLRNPAWWWNAYNIGLRLYKNGFDFDVVHCHDLDTLFAGILLKKKIGIKLVYDAHEIFGYMIARDMPHFVVKISFLMEKILSNKVDKIVTVNKPLKEYFMSIVDKIPITIVMNCKDLVIDEYKPSKNEIFTVLYIGILHKNRMFPDIVKIIGSLSQVNFIIAGQKENLYEIVKDISKEYSNIHFLGTIPFKEVISYTLNSDVVLCMINPEDPNNKIALSNKQFEAMVCGRPIITTNGTYVGKITRNLKCGLVINYDEDSLRKAVLELISNNQLCEKLGKNALAAAIKKFNWSKQKEKLINMYRSL